MRELNQAWEVLRSPARRADYDMQLRGATPVWQQGGVRPKRTAPVTGPVADLEPDRPGDALPPRRGLRVGPILVVAAALLGLLGFAAWANSSSSDGEGEVRVEAGTPFERGDCVVLLSLEGRITPVPGECSAVGSMRIDAILDLGRPCPPDTHALDQQLDEQRLCLEPSP